MDVLATLAEAPTTAIAVVAIVLGVVVAARGRRGERDGAGQVAPGRLLDVPVSAPETDPGFIGPEGTVVGHGPIRLGHSGHEAAPEPAPELPPTPTPTPDVVEPAPVAGPDPATGAAPAPELAAHEQPAPAVPEPPAPAVPEPAAPEPQAPPRVVFRHGQIKLGDRGRPPNA